MRGAFAFAFAKVYVGVTVPAKATKIAHTSLC